MQRACVYYVGARRLLARRTSGCACWGYHNGVDIPGHIDILELSSLAGTLFMGLKAVFEKELPQKFISSPDTIYRDRDSTLTNIGLPAGSPPDLVWGATKYSHLEICIV